MTEIYLHIVARMADYIWLACHPYREARQAERAKEAAETQRDYNQQRADDLAKRHRKLTAEAQEEAQATRVTSEEVVSLERCLQQLQADNEALLEEKNNREAQVRHARA